jgi:hypothetical protein
MARLPVSVFVLACLTMGCLRRPDEKQIVLSYREVHGDCGYCGSFELQFRSGGNVVFRGLGGCALPGTHRYRIPDVEWASLVKAFRDSDFFSIARTGRTIGGQHGPQITIAYRDARRVHETIDLAGDRRLAALAQQLRRAGHVEHWLDSGPESYRAALADGWNVNSRDERGENALACAAVEGRVDAARVLLDAGAAVSREAFRMAIFANPDATMLALFDSVAPLDVHGRLAHELLVLAANEQKHEALVYLRKRGVS